MWGKQSGSLSWQYHSYPHLQRSKTFTLFFSFLNQICFLFIKPMKRDNVKPRSLAVFGITQSKSSQILALLFITKYFNLALPWPSLSYSAIWLKKTVFFIFLFFKVSSILFFKDAFLLCFVPCLLHDKQSLMHTSVAPLSGCSLPSLCSESPFSLGCIQKQCRFISFTSSRYDNTGESGVFIGVEHHNASWDLLMARLPFCEDSREWQLHKN